MRQLLSGEKDEIRQVFEAEDFGEVLTPTLRAQEEHLHAKLENQQRKEGRS